MPIDDINKTNSLSPTVLQVRVQPSGPFATSLLNIVKNPVAVAIAATQNLTPTQQAALLDSEALQTLNLKPTAPAEPLLANNTTPASTTILESQGLSPAQEAALAVNETVQTALETKNLSPAQQAALAANQATQTLVPPETTPPTATPVAPGGQTLPPGTVTTAQTPGTTTTVVETPPEVNFAVPATAPSQIATTTETTVASEALNPAPPATARPIEYKNAVAAYEIRNPSPPPADPTPIRKEVHPSLSIGRVRPVDPLVLRQEWEKRKKSRSKETESQEDNTQPPPPLAEKSIQQMIKQANEDLAASGVPLHLVLAKTEEGFALDIYDSSDDAVCQMTQEIPLDLNHLLTTLDNLEHEAGLIVNIKT
ncbi:MAG: hypothetical protein WC256_03625 [Desulfurivibrionaceae bacterium]|jgi:hypothetical protein